jgi:hypothetical protein
VHRQFINASESRPFPADDSAAAANAELSVDAVGAYGFSSRPEGTHKKQAMPRSRAVPLARHRTTAITAFTNLRLAGMSRRFA